MDYQELKLLMRSKARLIKGFVNLLNDDAACIYNDVVKLDMVDLDEDIRELKRTAQQLVDVTIDLEHYMLLLKRDTADNK